MNDTSTTEYINVGVVLNAPQARFAQAILRPTYGRLSRVFPGMNSDHFRRVIRHLQTRFDELSSDIAEGMDILSLPANALELAHSVIAPDDSAFQWSPMGSGLASDLPATLETIYRNMVERYEWKPNAESRSDEMVWRTFKHRLEEKRALAHFRPKTIAVADDEVDFAHAWKNTEWHCLEPVSFDLMQPQSIKDKAHSWLGRMTSIQEAARKDPFKVYYLVGEPQLESSRRAFAQALNVLHKTPVKHEIIRENEAEDFAATIGKTIAEHEAELKR